MELLKDYNCTIEYYLEKANVVADALSQKSGGSLHHICTIMIPLLIELRKLNVEFAMDASTGVLATLKVRLILLEMVAAAQQVEEKIEKLCEDAKNKKRKN